MLCGHPLSVGGVQDGRDTCVLRADSHCCLVEIILQFIILFKKIEKRKTSVLSPGLEIVDMSTAGERQQTQARLTRNTAQLRREPRPSVRPSLIQRSVPC